MGPLLQNHRLVQAAALRHKEQAGVCVCERERQRERERDRRTRRRSSPQGTRKGTNFLKISQKNKFQKFSKFLKTFLLLALHILLTRAMTFELFFFCQ
jgi:hypothetical protein